MSHGGTTRSETAALDEEGYEGLLRATTTNRERLVVRLAGEVGLRPVEMVAVRPGDVAPNVVDGTVHYLVQITAGSDSRDVYLPADLQGELSRYAIENDISPEDPVFDVSVRRLQMLVAEVSSRAAAATGRPELDDVSSSDLRQYFARRLLGERELPPGVVMAVGGWTELASLAPYVEDPTPEDVLAAFAAATDTPTTSTADQYRLLDALDRPVVVFDGDAQVAHVNRPFETRSGSHATAVVGESFSALTTADPIDTAAIWETLTAGECWRGDLDFGGAGPSPVSGQTTITPLVTARDGRSRFVAVVDSAPADGPATDGRFTSVQQVIRGVGDVIADATTHEGVLHGVCEHFAASAVYECAWISDAPPGEASVPHVWAGADDGTIERLAFADPSWEGDEFADEVVEHGAVRTRTVDPARSGQAPGTTQPTETRSGRVVATPLIHGESVYGALCLLVQNGTVDEFERRALAAVGERIGEAIAGAERKRLLLADTVLELEFRCTDAHSVVVSVSDELSCSVRLDGVVPVDEDSLLCYLRVSGTTPEAVHPVAARLVDETRLVADYEDSSLLEVTIPGDTLAGTLVDHGGTVEEFVADDGDARLRAEFALDTDVRAVADAVAASFPETELVAKREVGADATTAEGFQQSLSGALTEKQLAVLRAAYHAGYFDWPRDSTAEELAESMGVSSPTLHNHLRRSQYKLLDAFLGGSAGED
ncbi:bacterio-opsin activator domain-containing protein [Haloarchaeobius sp. DFWS5]|uniref:bacterio-opsin activator domain-containing protein n=1 Tax=Haloarchaeobius sp. DFWS5 TaxID=3446114 RepID=UPI003EC02B3C